MGLHKSVSGPSMPDGTPLCESYACSRDLRRDEHLRPYKEEWKTLFMKGADMKALLSAESKTEFECTDCRRARQHRTRVPSAVVYFIMWLQSWGVISLTIFCHTIICCGRAVPFYSQCNVWSSSSMSAKQRTREHQRTEAFKHHTRV